MRGRRDAGRMRARGVRGWGLTGVLAAALVASACGSPAEQAAVTVTNVVTVPETAADTAAAPPSETSSAPADTASSGTSPAAATSPASSAPATSPPAPSPATSPAAPPSGQLGQAGVAMPSGFVPTKLEPGQQPPQFVIVSFDGVGWHDKWQFWRDIGEQVPFRFTGFLSGTYMLSDETRDAYQGPGHERGDSSINWNLASDLPVQIQDLNEAYLAGNEIGTHFNGHFCEGDDPSGNAWSEADWNSELDQFFALLKDFKANNPAVTGLPDLAFDASAIIGERTPCLEGKAEALYPALVAHNMLYDTSFTRQGISWPKQSPQYKIWQMGMAEFPIHGTDKFQITMDYNFYFTQRQGSSAGVTPEQSAADAEVVRATYQDMYDATFNGNRAPLILGNHFNEWNNSAYQNALADFVLATCGKPDTVCVPFRDLLAWMQIQDPAVLAELQARAPELGPRG